MNAATRCTSSVGSAMSTESTEKKGAKSDTKIAGDDRAPLIAWRGVSDAGHWDARMLA